MSQVNVGDEVVVVFDHTKPNPTGEVVWLSQKTANVRVRVTLAARGYSVGDQITLASYDVSKVLVS